MSLKSIFDGVYVDQLIQKNDRGEIVVYPHGMLGRGYVLPPEREDEYRRRVRRMMAVSIFIGFGAAMLILRAIEAEGSVSPFGWVAVIAVAGLLLAGMIHYQSRIVIGLQPSADPRPSVATWMRRGRRARATWTCWFNVIVGSLMAIASVAAIVIGMHSGENVVIVSGVLLLLLSLFAVWDGVMGLQERRHP